MPLAEPSWWYAGKPSLAARSLSPVALLWGKVAEHRFSGGGKYRAAAPVICVGNFTAGGTGKTPLAIRIATDLLARGVSPAFLTRGYGGRTTGPHWVSSEHDTAAEVGDEPMLLARVAPTLVSRDRALGAQVMTGAEAGAGAGAGAEKRVQAIIMDDGLQNGALVKDLTIAVVDGRRGVGNGLVIPAGPLRAPLPFQLALADAVVVNASAGGDDDGESDFVGWLRDHFGGPVLRATTQPAGDVGWLRDLPVLAFSGIGAPGRFFGLLERLGARIVARRSFPDHHNFTERNAEALLGEAQRRGATLCTTEKDQVRMAGRGGALGILSLVTRTVAIRPVFNDRDSIRLSSLIDASLAGRGIALP